ncbi:hypothetical protein [Georgenia satyanarayanai]|nr:hypothetical protein [Georgenia satyanarayanai]
MKRHHLTEITDERTDPRRETVAAAHETSPAAPPVAAAEPGDIEEFV